MSREKVKISEDVIYGPDELGYMISLVLNSDNSTQVVLMDSLRNVIDEKNVWGILINFPPIQRFVISQAISRFKKKAISFQYQKTQMETLRLKFAKPTKLISEKSVVSSAESDAKIEELKQMFLSFQDSFKNTETQKKDLSKEDTDKFIIKKVPHKNPKGT